MLKDGTSEVWPESVEKIFVDGAVIAPLFVPQPSHLYVVSPFQAFGNTGNLHGPRIRAAAADGATNFSSTT
jgi:hypothetical protein